MKKSFILLSLFSSFCAFGGVSTPSTLVEPVALPPIESHPYCVSLQAGIMHTEVGKASMHAIYQSRVGSDSESQIVPSILYGLTLSADVQLTEPGESMWIHTVGCSIGYYTGDETGRFKDLSIEIDPVTDGLAIGVDGDVDTTVNVIPIQVTYNAVYEVTESLYVYAGVRGGVIIRKTKTDSKASLYAVYENGDEIEFPDTFDGSSTKVLPTLGVGAGMRAYMTENLAFDLSYDFNMTFGNDCKTFRSELDKKLPGTTESSRYYGTVKAGFSYSF